MRKRVDFWILAATGLLFGSFVLNVLLGKAALLYGFDPILQFGDVGEFLILLVAIIAFVIEVLRRELEQANLETKSANKAEEKTQ